MKGDQIFGGWEATNGEEGTIKVPPLFSVSIDDLRVDGENPNSMSDEQFEALQQNFLKFGFLDPVLVNKDGLVVDGEHRIRAAQKLGMKKVLAVVVDVNEVDRRMLRIITNRLRGEHDMLKEAIQFQKIKDGNEQEQFLKLLALEKKQFEDVLKLQSSDEELYKQIRERKDSMEKQFKTFSFTVTLENEKAVRDALEKTGYKDQDKAFLELIKSYNASTTKT